MSSEAERFVAVALGATVVLVLVAAVGLVGGLLAGIIAGALPCLALWWLVWASS